MPQAPVPIIPPFRTLSISLPLSGYFIYIQICTDIHVRKCIWIVYIIISCRLSHSINARMPLLLLPMNKKAQKQKHITETKNICILLKFILALKHIQMREGARVNSI